MPQMTAPCSSPTFVACNPLPNRHSILSSSPRFLIYAAAEANGPLFTSPAITLFALPRVNNSTAI